jgi:hypothetical protein
MVVRLGRGGGDERRKELPSVVEQETKKWE